jgi:hypothetical protein
MMGNADPIEAFSDFAEHRRLTRVASDMRLLESALG